MIAVSPAMRTHSVTGCTIVVLQTRADMPNRSRNRSRPENRLRSQPANHMRPLLASRREKDVDTRRRRHEAGRFRHHLVVHFLLRISAASLRDAHVDASLQKQELARNPASIKFPE